MNWHDHSNLRNKHALLNPSSPGWHNIANKDELIKRLLSKYATEVGTVVHADACEHILYSTKYHKANKSEFRLNLLQNKIPKSVVNNLDIDSMFTNTMAYVNDAIGYRMDPEVELWYSDWCFGTADAIIFKDGILRIHDLKTGTTPAKMDQLLTYAALFCLEYKIKPGEIDMELRIYQNNEVVVFEPEVDDVAHLMDHIIYLCKDLDKMEK